MGFIFNREVSSSSWGYHKQNAWFITNNPTSHVDDGTRGSPMTQETTIWFIVMIWYGLILFDKPNHSMDFRLIHVSGIGCKRKHMPIANGFETHLMPPSWGFRPYMFMAGNWVNTTHFLFLLGLATLSTIWPHITWCKQGEEPRLIDSEHRGVPQGAFALGGWPVIHQHAVETRFFCNQRGEGLTLKRVEQLNRV